MFYAACFAFEHCFPPHNHVFFCSFRFVFFTPGESKCAECFGFGDNEGCWWLLGCNYCMYVPGTVTYSYSAVFPWQIPLVHLGSSCCKQEKVQKTPFRIDCHKSGIYTGEFYASFVLRYNPHVSAERASPHKEQVEAAVQLYTQTRVSPVYTVFWKMKDFVGDGRWVVGGGRGKAVIMEPILGAFICLNGRRRNMHTPDRSSTGRS